MQAGEYVGLCYISISVTVLGYQGIPENVFCSALHCDSCPWLNGLHVNPANACGAHYLILPAASV
jgi:hypothetical protein